MKILLLRINNEEYVPERIEEEAGKLGHQLDILQYKDLVFKFDSSLEVANLKENNIDDYHALILRVAGTSGGGYIGFRDNLIKYFLKENKVCLNGQSYLNYSRLDKLIQHFHLSKSGLPVVNTLCFGKNISSKEFIRRLTTEFDFPVITKPRFGAQGKGIYLLNNEKELKEFFAKVKKNQHPDIGLWLFQRYLTTKSDKRIIVLGEKILGAMKRTAGKGMYITNFSQGGKVSQAQISDEEKRLALKTAKLFKLDYAGVDIMEDKKGNKYILEVNRACQFKGFEQSTGVNVAKSIVRFLSSIFDR